MNKKYDSMAVYIRESKNKRQKIDFRPGYRDEEPYENPSNENRHRNKDVSFNIIG